MSLTLLAYAMIIVFMAGDGRASAEGVVTVKEKRELSHFAPTVELR